LYDPESRILTERTEYPPEWQIYASGKYTGASLTHVSHLYVQTTLVLLSGATDGYVSLWHCNRQVPKLLQIAQHTSVEDEEQWTVVLQKRVHQSSIKSCETILLSKSSHVSTYLACTGGDDNGIGLCLIELSKSETAEEETDKVSIRSEALVIPNAHAGAITAIRLLSKEEAVSQPDLKKYKMIIATVGADQYLRLWKIEINLGEGPESWSVEEVAERHASVADPGAMELRVYKSEVDGVPVHRIEGLVCGIGMELWSLNVHNL
jgi:hypothetical protein